MRLIDADRLKNSGKYVIMPSGAVDVVTFEDIDNAPTIGGWIPVTERLPKDKEPVLVTVKWFDGVTRMQRDAHFKGGWLSDCDDSQVIAWMPLPEPYSIESDGIEEDDDE